MDAKINELVTAMITLYHDDPKRIHHFMKVYAFASAIAQSEQVNALLQTRIEAARKRRPTACPCHADDHWLFRFSD